MLIEQFNVYEQTEKFIELGGFFFSLKENYRKITKKKIFLKLKASDYPERSEKSFSDTHEIRLPMISWHKIC